MICIFVFLTCGHLIVSCMPITHCICQLLFVIFLPIAWGRIPDVMDENRDNVVKLESFEALNECADKYTNIDVVRVDNELDMAYEALSSLNGWITLTFIIWFVEVIFIIVITIVHFTRACSSDSDQSDDDYAKLEHESDM